MRAMLISPQLSGVASVTPWALGAGTGGNTSAPNFPASLHSAVGAQGVISLLVVGAKGGAGPCCFGFGRAFVSFWEGGLRPSRHRWPKHPLPLATCSQGTPTPSPNT